MTGKTHIMGGIASAAAVAHYQHYDPTIFIIAGAFGAVLPDICHGGSKIGRRFPLISKVINTIFGHRTFTHSLLFLLLVGYLLTLFTDNSSIIMGVLVGMVSHFILDAATKNGIKLFLSSQYHHSLPNHNKNWWNCREYRSIGVNASDHLFWEGSNFIIEKGGHCQTPAPNYPSNRTSFTCVAIHQICPNGSINPPRLSPSA